MTVFYVLANSLGERSAHAVELDPLVVAHGTCDTSLINHVIGST